MNIAIYSTIFLVALVTLSLVGRLIRKKNGDDSVPTTVETTTAQPAVSKAENSAEEEEECCGEHEVCEKGKIKRALRTDIEYFDDEELDRFKGKKPEEYTESEIEEFRHVLYTMREEEVENWAHCIETRGIELPGEIKEEILLMLQ